MSSGRVGVSASFKHSAYHSSAYRSRPSKLEAEASSEKRDNVLNFEWKMHWPD